MHVAAAFADPLLIGFQIEVEMGKRMVLDPACFNAKLVEFRQSGASVGALGDEAAFDVGQGALKLCVRHGLRRVVLETCRRALHDSMPR